VWWRQISARRRSQRFWTPESETRLKVPGLPALYYDTAVPWLLSGIVYLVFRSQQVSWPLIYVFKLRFGYTPFNRIQIVCSIEIKNGENFEIRATGGGGKEASVEDSCSTWTDNYSEAAVEIGVPYLSQAPQDFQADLAKRRLPNHRCAN
jgi:hypothetical protein